MRRVEWIGDGTNAAVEDECAADATMADFAYEATEALLATEPRLRTVARLVEKAGPLNAEEWREVGVLVAAFLGQGRRLPIIVPVTSESSAGGSHLTGETTRLRYMAALHDLTGQRP